MALLPPQFAALTYQSCAPAVRPPTAQEVDVVVHRAVAVLSTKTEYVIGDVPAAGDQLSVALALFTVVPEAGLGFVGVDAGVHATLTVNVHGPPVVLPQALLAVTRQLWEPTTPASVQLVAAVVQTTLSPSSST
jgi:hypothetical protein